MLGVEVGPCRQLGLVRRFDSLFFVPPGAAAIEIGSNFRSTDNVHKWEYSTNFLFFIPRKIRHCEGGDRPREAIS